MNLEEIRGFRRILRRFERVTATQLKSCCARVTLPQCLVLLEIDEAAELTMSDLAIRLRLDGSTLTRTVDGLVRDGLAARKREASDRRVVRIRLTRQGEAVCRSIHAENDDHARRVFAHIPASRRATVLRGFQLLVQAFLDEEAARTGAAPSTRSRSGGKERAS